MLSNNPTYRIIHSSWLLLLLVVITRSANGFLPAPQQKLPPRIRFESQQYQPSSYHHSRCPWSSPWRRNLRRHHHLSKSQNQDIQPNGKKKNTNVLQQWWKNQQPKGVTKQRIQDMMQRHENWNLRNSNFVVVITGATGGIGQSLCQTSLRLGASIVFAMDVNEGALQELQEECDTDDDNKTKNRIRTIVADFSDLDSVMKASQQIIQYLQKEQKTIDILVNNAGIFYGNSDGEVVPMSKQGYDLCFQINYLSHFLLTESLVPYMTHKIQGNTEKNDDKTDRVPSSSMTTSRIVQVTSGLHWAVDGSSLLPTSSNNEDPPASWGSDNPKDQLPHHVSEAYGNSKLALIWYATTLNRNHGTTKGVTAVSACPSWAATGIAGEDEWGERFLQELAFPTESSQEEEYLAGPGISSILNAMFLPTKELDPNLLTGKKILGNARVMEYFFGRDPIEKPIDFLDSPWVKNTFGHRALLFQSLARLIILPFQRFAYDELIYQVTSYEAWNNNTNQLYQWSIQTTKEWIKVPMETIPSTFES